jgi:hypothetical protein
MHFATAVQLVGNASPETAALVLHCGEGSPPARRALDAPDERWALLRIEEHLRAPADATPASLAAPMAGPPSGLPAPAPSAPRMPARVVSGDAGARAFGSSPSIPIGERPSPRHGAPEPRVSPASMSPPSPTTRAAAAVSEPRGAASVECLGARRVERQHRRAHALDRRPLFELEPAQRLVEQARDAQLECFIALSRARGMRGHALGEARSVRKGLRGVGVLVAA